MDLKPQFIIDFDSPNTTEILQWLIANIGFDGWASRSFCQKSNTKKTVGVLYMSDEFAMQFKLMFENAELINETNCDVVKAFFIDDSKFCCPNLVNADIWPKVR